MKHFLIAAVAALAFGAPAMAQSYGGHGGHPYSGQQTYRGDAHARGYNGSGYGQPRGSYYRGLGYGYDDRNHNARAERREWRQERRHARRERRGGHGYGY